MNRREFITLLILSTGQGAVPGAGEWRSVNVAQLGATDFPQHFEAAVKFLPIVRIECKAKRQRGSGSI